MFLSLKYSLKKGINKIIIISSLMMSSIGIYAQLKTIICGKIKFDNKFYINIYEPINGYYNLAFFDTSKQNSVLVNGIDSVHKIITLSTPSFIEIYFRNEKNQFITLSNVLVFPGDSIFINVNLNIDGPNSIQYSGSNGMGQRLFNEINFQPYDKFIPLFDILDKLPSNKTILIKEIDSIVLTIVNKFDTLQNIALISSEYREYISICFKALFYNEVVNKFLRPGTKREIIDKKNRDSILTSLFKAQNPIDKRLSGLYLSPFYINNYFNFLSYKKYNLNSIQPLIEGDKTYKVNRSTIKIGEDFGRFPLINDETKREDLWALEILGFFSWMPGKYDKSIIFQFESIYPKSKWIKLLKKQFSSKYVFKNIGYKLQSPIKFVDSFKTINTVNELIKKLPKDKAFFIDIWATWCGPCISAFGSNKQIDSFLIINKVEKIYISINDETDYLKWHNAIKRYLLGGYHILANSFLKEDIRKNIFHNNPNEGMPIPRYVIVNKKGNIIIEDAFSPQDFDLLIDQISNAVL